MQETFCGECGRPFSMHEEAQKLTAHDYKSLLLLQSHPSLEQTLTRVISQWRGHALPACDPLAID